MSGIEKKEYTFSNEIGDAQMAVYEVFPGVQLVYHSVHMDKLDLKFSAEGKLIEIHHCREGRIEQKFEDNYFYLMPGDLSVAIRKETVKEYHFPLRHYHGITIGINMDVVSPAFWRMLEEMQVHPLEVAKKLCGENECFILRSEKYIEHIFSELYTVPENIKAGYFKVKVLELLLMLSGSELYANRISTCTLSKYQVQLADEVSAYLSKHMNEHVKIEELAKQFNISATHLKSIFKGVYGVPIFSYMRIRKMQSAAQLLIHTERSIMEIANEFGYNNGSKFSAAFRQIMGETPSEYRKMHGKKDYSDRQ